MSTTHLDSKCNVAGTLGRALALVRWRGVKFARHNSSENAPLRPGPCGAGRAGQWCACRDAGRQAAAFGIFELRRAAEEDSKRGFELGRVDLILQLQ